MQSFKERLVIEHDELKEKTGKLTTFINGPMFSDLDVEEQADLRCQLTAMTTYCDILERRLKRRNLF